MRIRRRDVIGLLGVWLLCAAQVHALDMKLQENVPTGGGGGFQFVTDTDREVGEPAIASKDPQAITPRYRVWIDFKKIEFTTSKQFRYELYVRAKTGGPFTRVIAQGLPVGAFEDRMVFVPFTITDGTATDNGTIRLPIFGAQSSEATLAAKKVEKTVEMPLSGERKIPLVVINRLGEMTTTVLRAQITSSAQGLWDLTNINGSNQTIVPLDFDLKRSGDVEVARLQLKPKTFQALASALVPHQGTYDDVITVNLDYKSIGRDEQPITIEIPVVFRPWPPLLLVMAVLGAFLGSLVPPTARTRTWKNWWRAFSTAAVVALIVELLSMVLKANAGILGLQLDPFELPSATLIGVFVGLTGYRSLDRLRNITNRFWGSGGSGNANP